MKEILHKKKKAVDIAFLSTSLLFVFWLLSIYEMLSTSTSNIWELGFIKKLLFKLMNDVLAVVVIATLCFPLYLLFDWIRSNLGKRVMVFLYIIFIGVQMGLISYSSTTLLNLGADILGYSLEDILLTIKSSASFSFALIFSILLFPVIFFTSLTFLRKYMNFAKLQVMLLLFLGLTGVGVFMPGFFNSANQNKLSFLTLDVIRYQMNKNVIQVDFGHRNDYPYLKKSSLTKDVLSPFLTFKKEKPSIVFVVLEGLGGEFVGKHKYAGFTPYLDSLASKSLFWPNFLSTTGRSFGVLPALMGSLPYGAKGFLELEKYPSHISLLSILKANGYTTSFYAGHQSSFDKKINFLEYHGVDHVVDENNFGLSYQKSVENEGGFSWGFPDAEIYRKTLSVLDARKTPRFDVILTLTNHEPFEFPKKELFLNRVEEMLSSGRPFNVSRQMVERHKEIFASLLYTDQSLATFMKGMSKRADYENTIFIITGDHRLIPITQKDQLCRYHVPLFIYSPLLKRVKTIPSISSHLDVAPSLWALLSNNFKMHKIAQTAWLGKGIDTVKQFRNIHDIPLMKYKGMTNDFVSEEFMYSDGKLFKIKENMGTYKVTDEKVLARLSKKLLKFKTDNSYMTLRNKLYPDSLNVYVNSTIEFSSEEKEQLKRLTTGLNFDEVFNVAREQAFSKKHDSAKLLCSYILKNLPNHVDARILKGRLHAWNGEYSEAEKEFLKGLNSAPFYDDVYLALLDLYWWSGQDIKSAPLGIKADENKIQNPAVSFKLAKAYVRLNKKDLAIKLMDSILKIHSDNVEYATFLKNLK